MNRPFLTPANIKNFQILCVCLFFLAVLTHYFSRRPLWLDEGFVYTNITDLSFRELFGPLKQGQSFPRVHLVMIKWLSEQTQGNVLALRLMALMSMTTAFFVWRAVFEKEWGEEKAGFLLSLAAFSMSYLIAYYAAELKPYAADVLAAGIFAYGLWAVEDPSENRTRSMGLVLSFPLTMFFSYAAMFFVPLMGVQVIRLARRDRQWRVILLAYFVLSGLIFWFIQHFDLRHAAAHSPLIEYWRPYFLCTESVGCFSETLWEGLRRLATVWYGQHKIFMQSASFMIPVFLYGLGRYGFGVMICNRMQLNMLGPIGAALFTELAVLSLLQKYPFTGGRITLFLFPWVVYFSVKGLLDLRKLKPLFYAFLGAYLILLAAAYGYSLWYFVKSGHTSSL